MNKFKPIYLTNEEIVLLHKCVSLRNQSVQFQMNEFTRDEIRSAKFVELSKEEHESNILMKLLKEEQS